MSTIEITSNPEPIEPRERKLQKLHVGCGKNYFKGWVNLDLDSPRADILHDVTKPLPFPDAHFDYIYHEHLLEHLSYDEGRFFLSECRRVLKADGVMRVAMPDLDQLVDRYQNDWRNQNWLSWPGHEFIQTRAQMINIAFRAWGHRHLYNREELERQLKGSGFTDIRFVARTESAHPDLNGRETREDSCLIAEAGMLDPNRPPVVPKVSYMTLSYNYARYLPEAIESVLAQDWPNLELVIVDDASTDESQAIIRAYQQKHPDRIRAILLEHNVGPAATARMAVNACTGDYISILDSDDVAYPERTRQSVEFLENSPLFAAVFGLPDYIDQNGARLGDERRVFDEAFPSNVRLRMLYGNFLNTSSVTVRAQVLKRINISPALRSTPDFNLWLNVLDKHEIMRLDQKWVRYRIHGANLSLNGQQGLPFSAPYETVQSILHAISRWLDNPAFVERIRVRKHALRHALARHCIALDRHYLGRPMLGLQKAHELIADALIEAPEDESLLQTLSFIHYLIGDERRAAGGKSVLSSEWRGPLASFSELPLQFREEAARCTLSQLERNLGESFAQTQQEVSFLNWLRQQWLSKAEKDALLPQLAPRVELLALIIDATRNQATEAVSATLRSIADQPVQPSIFFRSHDPRGVPAGCQHLPADKPLVHAIQGVITPTQWLLCLQPGDLLDADAVLQLLRHLETATQAALIYADETRLDKDDVPSEPHFKPDFDIDHLRARPYLGRFLLMRAGEFAALEGFDENLGEARFQDYAFRLFERFGATAIGHLPHLLFHGIQQPAIEPQILQAVLAAHLRRSGIEASIEPGLLPDSLRIRYRHAGTPMVSIIIPTKNQQAMLARCIETLTSQTTYTNYELLIVDNQSDEADARAYIAGIEGLGLPQLRVLHYDHPFNYSSVNNFAAREARGEYLVLLNNDTAILDGNWLEALLNHARRPEVGIVGAKLLFPDGRIQHGGVILGLRGPADHPFIGDPMKAPGYGGRLMLDQQYSAVTAACLMIRKSIYDEVGGLDEEAFKVSYNDVDLCLKVRSAGYTVVWTPYAQLMHVANVSQNAEDPAKQEAKRARFAGEQREMYRRWMPWIKADPAYNANFRLKGSGFELESNPVFRPASPGLKKLLAHNGDIWGSGLYRMIAPATVLAEEGLIAGGCYRDYFMPAEVARIDPDVIVLQRQTSDEQIAGAADYRSYSKAKLVFELDDYLPNVPISNIHKKNLPLDLVRRLRKAMDICERIVVSTEPLREAILPFHDHIVVLPNYLPKKLWGNIPLRAAPDFARRPRVGWAGGSSHTGDLRVIADVVRALADRVDWVFFGMKPEGVDDCIAEFHPGVHLGQYPAKLASLDLDLALAPLEDNLFNECKSNLRLLELGICGYPVVASDLAPYRCSFPVTLVGNRFRDWVGLIEEKLADRSALYAEGIALQNFVRSGWMLEGDNLLRWREGWLLTPER